MCLGFLKCFSVPQCLGVTDRTCIEIKQPSLNLTDFINIGIALYAQVSLLYPRKSKNLARLKGLSSLGTQCASKWIRHVHTTILLMLDPVRIQITNSNSVKADRTIVLASKTEVFHVNMALGFHQTVPNESLHLVGLTISILFRALCILCSN